MASAYIFAKKDYVGQDGLVPLYLRLTTGRKFYNINIQKRVLLAHWDDARRQAGPKHPNCNKLNRVLQQIQTRADEIILDHELSGRPITVDSFRKELGGHSPYNFYEVARRYIRQHQGVSSRAYVDKVEYVIGKLKLFRPTLELHEMNYAFLKDYQHWLATVRKNGKNTIHSNMRIIRRIYKEAVKEKLIRDNPFDHFKLERVKTQREVLTVDEIKTLEQLLQYGLPYYLRKTLCWFLLALYTGRRYGDLVEFRNWKFYTDFIRIEQMKRVKGRDDRKIIMIYLNDKIRKILDDIRTNEYRPLSNAQANKFLKEVVSRAGIDKDLSFHCARHTFAFINKKLNSDLALRKELLGHDSINSTMVYDHTDGELLKEAMLKWNSI